MTEPLLTGLALARGPLREDASWREDPQWFDRALNSGALVVAVTGADLDVDGDGLMWRGVRPDDRDRAILLGLAEEPRLAVLDTPANPGNLRLVGSALSDSDAAWATAAVALSQWHRSHSRCPRCGGQTRVSKAGWSRTCDDDHEIFPRTDPAVIVLVRDGEDRALLGRRSDWPPTWFSTLAGFVEAGESAEQAVRREILEEAGVELDPDRLTYRGSQPWPFPASLMLGYHAWTRADEATSTPDGEEIAETRWFTRAEMAAACEGGEVLLPPPVSIARRLIEDWFGSPLPGNWVRP